MTVLEILEQARKSEKYILRDYLKEHGFDGLWNDGCECGCAADDIGPCGELSLDCEAAYRRECADCPRVECLYCDDGEGCYRPNKIEK